MSMGSAKNIQRDAIWINPDSSDDRGWSNNSLLSAQQFLCSGDPTVKYDYACVQTNPVVQVSVTVANQKAVGVFMQQPIGDNTPYRIHAACNVSGVARTNTNTCIGIGYGPATLTGASDTIVDPYYLPFYETFDGLVMIPSLPAGDPLEDRALCFAICLRGGFAIQSEYVTAHISVQRLSVKPPTMHNAVA